jgi:hypothetical protein
MATDEGPIIVTIHCIRTGANDDFAVFAGKNPFGPRGGRCGNVMDGECIAQKLLWAEAVHVFDKFIATHPGTLPVLTESQTEGAKRVRDADKVPLPDFEPARKPLPRYLSRIWRFGKAWTIFMVSRLTVMTRRNSSSG